MTLSDDQNSLCKMKYTHPIEQLTQLIKGQWGKAHESSCDEIFSFIQVIRENKDYKNSDRVAIGDTTPKFKFVMKKSPPKVVLVLDVSGSMNSEGRLIKLRQVT